MNRRKGSFAVVAIVAFWASAADAQPRTLEAERAAVLKSIGDVEQTSIQLFPLATGPAAFRQVITRPDALTLRLHFTVRQAGQDWRLQVKGQGTSSWSIADDEAAAGGFWSDELPGSRVEITIESTAPGNTLELVIDKVVIGRSKITPVSIVGPNQLSPIGRQDAPIVALGRSVARLRFVADGGGSFVCTGFLITRDLMMTNQHCLATATETESALVDFDFDSATAQRTTLRLKELLATDVPLDFSIVRLAAPVDRAPLELSTTRPADGAQLLIIQHPAGEPKQVSIADCVVVGPVVPGRDGSPVDFGHGCDTKGGSSGSPVFDFEAMKVIGLHHLGFPEGLAGMVNQGTHLDRILAALSDELRAELGNQ
jgi:hypothetical protein